MKTYTTVKVPSTTIDRIFCDCCEEEISFEEYQAGTTYCITNIVKKGGNTEQVLRDVCFKCQDDKSKLFPFIKNEIQEIQDEYLREMKETNEIL